MTPTRTFLRRGGLALAALVGLLALPAAAQATTPATAPGVAPTAALRYVNMGDSYSAGSGVAPPAVGADPRCTQSQLNWGHDLAQLKGYQLRDVSCGGAQTKDFTTSQFPGVAPQLEALSSSTQLVTLTIGGNDGNVFIDSITKCGTAAARTAGQGSPCKDTYGASFRNTIRNSTYPAIVKTLKQVKAKAPKARIGISGYLQILPSTGGCYPIMPVASGDVPYLNDIQGTLNDAVARAAKATGVTYIDQTNTSMTARDACAPLGQRWVEPIVGSTNTVPVHPNALGEKAMADRAAAVLVP